MTNSSFVPNDSTFGHFQADGKFSEIHNPDILKIKFSVELV